MIGSLRGTLLDRTGTDVTVEVGGMGYRMSTTPATSGALGVEGSEVFVWVHHHIREDAQTLYGFAGREERDVFETLIGTHGVGPALGLAILSTHSPRALRLALATDDVSALCLVPGVGCHRSLGPRRRSRGPGRPRLRQRGDCRCRRPAAARRRRLRPAATGPSEARGRVRGLV